MDIHLQGNAPYLYTAIESLEDTFGFKVHTKGSIVLTIEQRDHVNELEITYADQQATIKYKQTHHFFRGFGHLLEKLKQSKDAFSIKETPQFNTVGPMFDFSRNAVMKKDAFRTMIHRLAIMGFNAAMLYMEDTYEVKGEPYFGYMRGRYSHEELKEMDDYASQFGIELIPCIQTLAHLEEFLKWEAVLPYKDTRGALLLESEPTYTLLENMIRSVSAPFRSKRIHIGMDEAEELGRGIYLNQNGHKPRFDLMKEHLQRLLKITDALELEVTMWSDMFLKLASSTGDAYTKSTEIPDYMIKETPEQIQLMYWQYNSTDVEHYRNIIRQHQAFKKKPAFAGGIWIWNTFATNYDLSLKASEAALQACKEADLDDVFVTLWGDDGQETTPFHALLGLLYYAEHAYHEKVTDDTWQERATFCTGIEANSFLLLSALDRPPGVEEDSVEQTNPSKFLLWQDVLLGLFDKHIEGLPVGKYYGELAEKFAARKQGDSEFDLIFETPEQLCRVLELKAEVGIQLKTAYDTNDCAALRRIAEETLPEIIRRIDELRGMHRTQWLAVNKPFGWEVLDIRYGGAVNRMETAIKRIGDYLYGEVNQLEELEQERLYYAPIVETSTALGWCSYYYRMASPNVFFHVLPIC